MATATGDRSGPGRRRTLNEEDILDAALGLLDEGGAAGASIRRIAAQVGVAPNAVYTYFADKAAVEAAVVERLLGRVDHGVFTEVGKPWQQRVEALALELWDNLTAHPGAVPLLVRGPMDGPHAVVLNERLLDVLGEGGLGPDEAARAAYLLRAYVFGSVALEVPASRQHSGDHTGTEAYLWGLRRILDGLTRGRDARPSRGVRSSTTGQNP